MVAHDVLRYDARVTENTKTEDRLAGLVVDGRFRLDRLLGKGGMGRVYAGTQLSVDRPVAVKILREEISDSELVQRRFFREAKIAAAIRHPNVVSIIDFGRDESLDALYIVMEYVDGRSLATMLRRGRLRLPLALHVARQVCSGLSEAHAAGIIHRDLKPDNVMLQLTAEGAVTARLLDFGIALPSGGDTRFTATGAILGTPHYMAPEQAQDTAVDARADLHALGVMLYEMLTGRLPWVAETPVAVMLKVVTTPPPPLEETLSMSDMPPDAVRALLGSLLQKNPADRPATAAEVGRRLDHLLSELGLASPSAHTLEALSDAEVIDRESEELVQAVTPTEAATPSRAAATPASTGSPAVVTTPATQRALPPKRAGWHPLWAIPVTFVGLAMVCAATTIVLGIIGSNKPSGTAEPPEKGTTKTITATKTVAKTKPKPMGQANPHQQVLKNGGICPEHENCDFGPTARDVGCRSDSTCGASCAVGGCRQSCEGEARCDYTCEGGTCTQHCGEQADCKLSCGGGGCLQYCSGKASCTLSCGGGGCKVERGDQAKVRKR